MSFKIQKNCSFWQRCSFVIDFSHTYKNVINATDLKVANEKRKRDLKKIIGGYHGIHNYYEE